MPVFFCACAKLTFSAARVSQLEFIFASLLEMKDDLARATTHLRSSQTRKESAYSFSKIQKYENQQKPDSFLVPS